ncbi:MAG TPA: phosphatidylcholine synthase [Roseiarcus sp.]|nr:phosphatidylcholine synthase [Roseiarcus sp.]
MSAIREKRRIPVQGAAALSVHVLTASGGAVAVLALYAAIERNFAVMFAWLGLALIIDGVDGTLARAARVKEAAAMIDGVILDLVVDFLSYVLVPVVAIWRSDLMPTPIAFWIGLVITIASALYFADTRMKTADNWFRGFPALWNVLAFYLFVFRLPSFANAAILVIATALMFTPIVFVHPMRVVKLRVFTVAATGLWSLCAIVATLENLAAGSWTKAGLALAALYFASLPLLRHSFWADSPA